MLFMCKKYPKNRERYRSICAATLITSLHALTSFHCMDTGRDSPGGDTCFKRDLSDGNENRVIFGCLNSAKVVIAKIGASLACCTKKFRLFFWHEYLSLDKISALAKLLSVFTLFSLCLTPLSVLLLAIEAPSLTIVAWSAPCKLFCLELDSRLWKSSIYWNITRLLAALHSTSVAHWFRLNFSGWHTALASGQGCEQKARY